MIYSCELSFRMSWFRERRPNRAVLLLDLSWSKGTIKAQKRTLIIRECFFAVI